MRPQTAEQPDRICLENRMSGIESNRQDGPRGVPADSRQLTDRIKIVWKYPVMVGDNLFSRCVQLPCAAIIAQAFPLAKHGNFFGGGKGLNVGKLVQESRKIPLNGRNLCLLQHNFADPNGIGITRLPPRQITSVGAIPYPQPPSHPLKPLFASCFIIGSCFGMSRHSLIRPIAVGRRLLQVGASPDLGETVDATIHFAYAAMGWPRFYRTLKMNPSHL